MMRIALRVALAAVVCAGLTPARAQTDDRIALVGGMLVDGMSVEPVADSVILIEGERIVETGSVTTLPVPEGFRVISTEGMTVLPGLWESHAHLMINGHSDYDHWDRTYPDRLASEIMPASAYQLLMAGVTAARDLGAPLEDSISVKRRIETGDIPGPRLFVSGPFIQHEAYPGTEAFRWGIDGVEDARAKIARLADAGVDLIKLIDQDLMEIAEVEAVVETAHARGLPVVAHSHRPEEIRVGLRAGVDNFEHTGLAAAPEYPPDIMAMLRERTATGRVHGGPLFWTPTVEGLWNHAETLRNGEFLDNDCWHAGLGDDTIADIRQSIEHPERLDYFQLTPRRKPTLIRKVRQLREAGVVLLVGTDSGIPMKFHCQSTWNELDVFVRVMGFDAWETIRAATYWPAVMMGVEADLGSVTPGKYADIIAVKGDVLRHINLLQRVDFVMKGGRVIKQGGRMLVPAPAPE